MAPISNFQRDVKVIRDYSFLRKPCKGWLDQLSHYHQTVKRAHEVDDWPFWYGERSLLGFLAAGFWGRGSVCIEEYRTDKKGESVAEGSQPRKRTYLGRGDLYFCRGDNVGNIEFKLHDIPVTETDHFEASLSRKLTIGRKDARRAHQAGIDDYCGMFLRPYIGAKRDPKHYEVTIKELLNTTWDTLEPAALAWWCPVRRVLNSDRVTKQLILGAILVIKQV
jgi:hypothetical protein